MKETRFRNYFSLAMMILSPAAAFLCVELFTHNPLVLLTVKVALWNILFYEMVYFSLFFLTGSVRPALILGDILFLVIGLGNYFVVSFRSNPIVPWDIYSIRTAASVANNFEYSLTPAASVCIVIFILLLFGAFFCRFRPEKLRLSHRLGALLGIVLLFGGYLHLLYTDSFIKSMKLDRTLFTPFYMSRKDGFTTAFLIDLQYMSMKTPEDYEPAESAAILDSYASPAPEEPEYPYPNIIVIMDEAFSDPAVLGNFSTNQDYMPFVHELQQNAPNTVSGYLNVSVKGGNTANTEYEFLTGNTMRFLPGGCVPYQQYIFGDKPSTVAWLNGLGYETAAIHPFNSTGWNRNLVYDYFGFDQMLFNNKFPGAARTRKYINDQACFEKVEELYENKDPGNPLFVFAVTMQNHSGYFEDFDNFTVDVTVDDNTYKPLNRYLSLMKLTDEALKDLVDYFSVQEERTILVFFGDHQPNDVIVEPIWKQNGKKGTDLTDEENDLRYQVPYILWANFDIEEETGTETSVNYLFAHAMEKAGIPLSPFQLCLKDRVEQTFPVITTQRLTDASGHELTEEEEESSEVIREYQKLQYYRMYDEPRE